MGGGDLNQKKSWHPHTFKNQERVWKAEQNEAAEKRKLAELQKEISDERGREELRRIGQASGIIQQDNGHKLEWMYRGPKDNLNREDYLLGRAVDKTFEQHAEEERSTENHLGVSVPKNHVEYECVPFSIRAYKDADPTTVQVDMARKIAEDPLMMIKQREMESRKKLLENPVKLKELKQLLQSEKGVKGKSKKKEKKAKKDKKAKKSKKKRKSDSSGSSESDVDDALLSMLSKQRGIVDEEVDMEDMDFQDVVNMKYDNLNKELDKMIGKKKKTHKESDNDDGEEHGHHHRRDGQYGGRNEDRIGRRSASAERRNRNNREQRNDYSSNRRGDRGDYDRNRSPNVQRGRDRSRSRDRYDRKIDNRHQARSSENDRKARGNREFQSHKQTNERRRAGSRHRSRTPQKTVKVREYDNSKMSRRSRTPDERPRNRSPRPGPKNRSPEERPNRLHHVSSRRSNRSDDSPSPERHTPPRRIHHDDSDDERRQRRPNQNYGLITASGESIALKNSGKSYTDRRATASSSKDVPKAENNWKKPSSKKPLTAEEKEAKLREMMQNAEWRNEERETYVRKYYENDRKEEAKSREFDRNFIHKELHKSAQSETVESRIKSNRNNIQRSSNSMNTNFARR